MSDIQSGFEPSHGGMPPKKSGSKVWMFAGLGCLLAALLCFGVFGIGAYMLSGPLTSVVAEMSSAEALIQSSAEVQAELGTPLVLESGQQDQNPNNREVVISGNVRGSKATGTYQIELVMEGAEQSVLSMKFKTKSITVQANGKTIEIDDDLGDLEEELDGIDLNFNSSGGDEAH